MKLGLGAATILCVACICAVARASDIDLACSRLDPAAGEELRARARLALRTAGSTPQALLVACDDTRAWVVWDGPPADLLQVKSEGDLVEAILDTIETRARQSGASSTAKQRPSKPKAPAQPPSPSEVPTFAHDAPLPPRERSAAAGGAGVGFSFEYLGDALALAPGPRLDLGVGWGPWYVTLGESARFAHKSESLMLFDMSGGFGYGAPFTPDRLFGGSLTSGIEWFSTGSHTVSTGVATLSLRIAPKFDSIAIALGLDTRMRFTPEYIGQAVDAQLPRWSEMLVIEGVLLAEPVQATRPLQ